MASSARFSERTVRIPAFFWLFCFIVIFIFNSCEFDRREALHSHLRRGFVTSACLEHVRRDGCRSLPICSISTDLLLRDFKNDAIIVTVSPDSAAVHVMTWDALRWKGDKFNYWISASGEVSCLDDSADVQCLSYYPGAFSYLFMFVKMISLFEMDLHLWSGFNSSAPRPCLHLWPQPLLQLMVLLFSRSDGSIFYCDDAHPKDNPGANITVRAYATGSWSQLWQTSASISDYVLMNYGPLVYPSAPFKRW